MKIAQMLTSMNWNQIKADLDNITAQIEAEQMAETKRIKNAAQARRIFKGIENEKRAKAR